MVVPLLPPLSYHFHLSPSDVWGMTVAEFKAYRDALDQLQGQVG